MAGETAAYSNKTYKFTVTGESISEVETSGSRPEPRSDHSAAVINNSMYIFGGILGEREFNDCWQLDLDTLIWSSIEAKGVIPSNRIGHASVDLQQYIVIFGGNKEVAKRKTHLYLLDTKTSEWKRLGDGLQESNEATKTSIDYEDYLRNQKLNISGMALSKLDFKTNPLTSPAKTQKTLNSIGSPNGIELERATSPKKGSLALHTPGNSSIYLSKLSRKGLGGKISQTKQLKKERLKKKKALEKQELLKEFQLSKEELEMEIEDPQIMLLKNTLDALGSGRDYNIPSPKKAVLRPGVARFHEKVEGKMQAVALPKLDGLTLHVFNQRIFVFGGDRSGLCSNDLYMVDILEHL